MSDNANAARRIVDGIPYQPIDYKPTNRPPLFEPGIAVKPAAVDAPLQQLTKIIQQLTYAEMLVLANRLKAALRQVDDDVNNLPQALLITARALQEPASK